MPGLGSEEITLSLHAELQALPDNELLALLRGLPAGSAEHEVIGTRRIARIVYVVGSPSTVEARASSWLE